MKKETATQYELKLAKLEWERKRLKVQTTGFSNSIPWNWRNLHTPAATCSTTDFNTVQVTSLTCEVTRSTNWYAWGHLHSLTQ